MLWPKNYLKCEKKEMFLVTITNAKLVVYTIRHSHCTIFLQNALIDTIIKIPPKPMCGRSFSALFTNSKTSLSSEFYECISVYLYGQKQKYIKKFILKISKIKFNFRKLVFIVFRAQWFNNFITFYIFLMIDCMKLWIL